MVLEKRWEQDPCQGTVCARNNDNRPQTWAECQSLSQSGHSIPSTGDSLVQGPQIPSNAGWGCPRKEPPASGHKFRESWSQRGPGNDIGQRCTHFVHNVQLKAIFFKETWSVYLNQSKVGKSDNFKK